MATFGTASFAFLRTGNLRTCKLRSANAEYLLAVMGFCQSCHRTPSIDHGWLGRCCSAASSLARVAKLQEFDFRNGPLHGSLTVVLRKCEDLLYELSLSGKYAPPLDGRDGDVAPPAKRARQDGATTASGKDDYPRLSAGEFDTMRAELKRGQREAVIKRTRDVQKLSKQAIYSSQVRV